MCNRAYKLRKKSAELLDHVKQGSGKHHHRTCTCGKPLSKAGVNLHNNSTVGTTFFSNIEQCGSIWTCPVCARKISERRKAEVLTMHQVHITKGKLCALLTLTFPHSIQDNIQDLREREQLATKRFKARREWRKVRDMIVGSIRSQEITYGLNGWHLHSHHLLFFDRKDITAKELYEIEQLLYKAWKRACELSGLPTPSEEHGVDLTFNAAGDYVAKWGLELEMTKGHLKTTKGRKGITPFQMLESENQEHHKKFVEYANAMKGKRYLIYSKGLLKHFGLDVILDDEIVELQQELEGNTSEITIDNKDYFYFWVNGFASYLLEVYKKGGATELIATIDNKKQVMQYLKRQSDTEKIAA